MAKKLPPVHPGEILREEFLLPLGLSPYAVARACAVPRTRIERLAREGDPRAVRFSVPRMGEVYRESSKAKAGDNRRRVERFKLNVPARVTGYDRNGGKWHEMTETIDVSRTGVRLRLRRRVKHGTVLFVTLPLPTKLRGHGFSEQSYNVYTLVRRVEPPRQGVRAVGVEFLGEHPPKGFLDNPSAIFRSGASPSPQSGGFE